ncbi:MAG: hypothetical protein FJ222_01610 [Lentisphaerae bacterium]|nr:hypothetical protein [Lentisphaerota bacterium]
MSAKAPVPDIIAAAAQARILISSEGAARVAAFFLSARGAAGLFRDRAGRPDLYYSVFGLGGLIALGVGLPQPRDVRRCLDAEAGVTKEESFTDCVSRIRCLRCLNLLGDVQPGDALKFEQSVARLERYRSADGGYSHEREHAPQGTVYAAYLVEQAHRDAGIAWRDPERTITALDTLCTPDGGYTNHSGTPRGSTTATAAAAVLLIRHGKCQPARRAVDYLARQRHPDGGYRASQAAPLPDLLSTATALYAESLCEPLTDKPPFRPTAAFIEGLWNGDSGFRSQAADPVSDVEYTFYALLALGALAAIHPSQPKALPPAAVSCQTSL